MVQRFRTLLLIALASALTVHVGRGQYRWRPALPVNVGSYNYEFSALSCWHNVCTVAAIRRNLDSVFTDNYFVLLFFRSIDGGNTWTEQDPGLPHAMIDNNDYIQHVQQIDSLNAVAMSDSGVVVITSDGGKTWVRRDLPARYDQSSFHFSNPMTGIVTVWVQDTDLSIFTTSDGGTNWIPSHWNPWLAATMCHSDGMELFRIISWEFGPLYYTSDDWNTVDSTALIVPYGHPADTEYIEGCNFRGDTLVAYGFRRSQQGPLILTSIDDGVHWSYIILPNTLKSRIDCVSSLEQNIVFAGGFGNDRHLFKSTDHGMTWTLDSLIYNSDTTKYETSAIAVTSGGDAIAIMGTYTVPSTSDLMVGVPTNDAVNTMPHVSPSLQVYPNPAENRLTVSPMSGVISILDPLGRKYPVREEGNVIDISGLPSGVYYVTGGNERTQFVKE